MDKHIKAVLAVVALCVLALPVKAEEKVWYCEMTGYAETNQQGEKTFKLEKFKMKVTSTKVIFGSGGAFDNASYTIVNRIGSSLFDASNEDGSTHISFYKGMFNIAIVNYENVWSISARCDDF